MANKPNIKALYEDQDLEGLVDALRFPGSPEVRAEAARALGALSNFEAVESLVYSTRQDPDTFVQKAALAALHELLGNTAEAVIASYGSLPEDEPWVPVSPPEGPGEPGLVDIWKDLEPGRTEVKWGHDDISALIAVLRNESNDVVRLRAIRALSQISSTEAIDALAKVALWEEDDASRAAATAALEEVFGEGLPEVLQSYRDSAGGDEDEWDQEIEVSAEDAESLAEEEALPEEEGPSGDDLPGGMIKGPESKASPRAIDAPQAAPANPEIRREPVVQEVKAGWSTALLVGLLLLAAIAVAIFIFTR